jgi:transcription elongation factor GreA
VIDDNDYEPDEVGLGATVKLYDLENNEQLTYTIVGSAEANLLENKISNESPVGKALLGQKAGNIVEVTVPAGQLKYQILEVYR